MSHEICVLPRFSLSAQSCDTIGLRHRLVSHQSASIVDVPKLEQGHSLTVYRCDLGVISWHYIYRVRKKYTAKSCASISTVAATAASNWFKFNQLIPQPNLPNLCVIATFHAVSFIWRSFTALITTPSPPKNNVSWKQTVHSTVTILT